MGNREKENTAKQGGESSCDKGKPDTFNYIIIKPFCIAKTIINNMTNICNICDTQTYERCHLVGMLFQVT